MRSYESRLEAVVADETFWTDAGGVFREGTWKQEAP